MDCPPDHVGVACEIANPELMAQDDDAAPAFDGIAGRKAATHYRLQRENVEKVGRDARSIEPLRMALFFECVLRRVDKSCRLKETALLPSLKLVGRHDGRG